MSIHLNILRDARVDCHSVLINFSIGEYLNLVETAYKNKGGIDGQRQPLKTKTAIRIRQRMKEDIKRGTVLPPVVVGVVLSEEDYKLLSTTDDPDDKQMLKLINSVSKESLSIIDGMQRTTALWDAVRENPAIKDRRIRVEYWVSSNTNSLLYRMLILNSGQVPWNLRRQIEIVYNALLNEVKQKVPNIHLMEIDENGNRSKAGNYQADQIAELFLVFGSRNYKVDSKEALADEFTKLDFIEATSDRAFSDIFFSILSRMCSFDEVIFDYKPNGGNYQETQDEEKEKRVEKFKKGKDLFGSQPARVGFITAFSIEIFGLPGDDKTTSEQHSKLTQMFEQMDAFLEKVGNFKDDELEVFLDFMTLNKKISKVVSKVGDFEREFFTQAFRTLIKENFRFNSLTPCWRT